MSAVPRRGTGPGGRSIAGRERTVLWVGFATVAVLAIVVSYLQSIVTADAGRAAVVGSLLVVLSLPVLVAESRRRDDPNVLWFLILAEFAKLAGAFVRYEIAFGVYGGRTDTIRYGDAAASIASAFRAGHFGVAPGRLSGTGFIELLTGISYWLAGPGLLTAYVVFSWLGFWGLYLFYRGIAIGVPESRLSRYAPLVFLLPSLAFWPSSVGKEAWVLLGLGAAASGAARLLAGRHGAAVWLALGLVAIARVRPHVAAIVVIALGVAWVLGRSPERHRELAPIVKVVVGAALAVAAFALVARTDAFLRGSGIRTDHGIFGIFEQTSERTGQGGSAYAPTIVSSPARLPIAVVTVLFRPFPFEGSSWQTVFAGLEGTVLLLAMIVRWRDVAAAVRLARRRPYVLFAIVYTGVFVFAFSSLANLGLLVRERVQVLPFLLVMLCVPAASRGRAHSPWPESRPTDRAATSVRAGR